MNKLSCVSIIKEFDDFEFAKLRHEKIYLPKWTWGLGSDKLLYAKGEYWTAYALRPKYYPYWELFSNMDIGITLEEMIRISDKFKDIIVFM